ncbi:hypothetical protein COW81_02610 [Candidatus Campbellbacteria bacterium CG22_combo_CG10-13_8_21_14_all_36_13]|uniref:SHS2 domain-containing protein n=1 Tax=Candidatus Campbellbacteria bacterium CG22_combo_CG10-13_8_21_14_all_36_13 TaxID=1974529 RepID=A0A2H0DZH7_9BACT|nr:MAG: hypothetical protein COW81_02610 [Candidatus Campbellbacteria bacterium CG22_combo_CG10-13_8_21_14_all_36_13]
MPNFKDVISGIFNKASGGQSVLGVDVSSSSIKVVQLRKKGGRAVLETYGELALGPYAKMEAGQATNLPPEIISEGLKDVLKEAKVTTVNCGVAIPLSASLITVMELPKMDEKQLASVVPLEARKYIPVAIQDVMLDWNVIPNVGPDGEDSKKLEVLIVAIHKDTIGKYQEIVRQAGLQASFFEIEIFSTIRSSLDRGITPILLIDFGVSTTKLYVVEAGVVKNSHSINKGSQDITLAISSSMGIGTKEAEQIKRDVGINVKLENGELSNASFAVLEYIISDSKRVMLAYERKHQRPITKIVFAGGGSLLKGLGDFASERFNVEVKIADPFKKVETPAFLEAVLSEAGPEFAVAIGTALRKLEELG